MSSRTRLLTRGIGLPALALAAGFVWFVAIALRTAEPPSHADGIVALTGGATRVSSALLLLAAGRADRLLISGVGGAVEFPALAQRAGVDLALAPRVTIGHTAASTRGNAIETAEWAAKFQVHSLIIVTGADHMPRARLELARAMPGITLIPAPVRPSSWHDGLGLSGMRRLGVEYVKFLGAAAGLSAVFARAPHVPEHA